MSTDETKKPTTITTVSGRIVDPHAVEAQNIPPRLANGPKLEPTQAASAIEDTRKFSIHELIGFDTEVNEAWAGTFATLAQAFAAFAAAAAVQSNKVGLKGNPRMVKAIHVPMLKVIREAIACVHSDAVKAAAGGDLAAAKQRDAFTALLTRIDEKLKG